MSREFGETVKFIPYGGIKYSDVNAKAKGTISGVTYETNDVDSKDRVGLYTGLEVSFANNLSVEVEGRFIDETAFSSGLKFEF